MSSRAAAIRSAPKAQRILPPCSSGTRASAESSISTSGNLGWCFRKNPIAARPSRPSPQMPTRRAPRSAARIEHGHVAFGNPVWMLDLEEGTVFGRISPSQCGKAIMQLPHQRKVGNARRYVILDVFREILFELQGFTVLMVDLGVADPQVWRAGGVL